MVLFIPQKETYYHSLTPTSLSISFFQSEKIFFESLSSPAVQNKNTFTLQLQYIRGNEGEFVDVVAEFRN